MAGLLICHNFLLISKNKLAGGTSRAFTKGKNTFTPFLTIFWVQTLAFAQISAFVLDLLDRYIDINL